jgi:hypothetical protein
LIVAKINQIVATIKSIAASARLLNLIVAKINQIVATIKSNAASARL